ncbi:hypothetical protein LCGC14_2156640, partial [marine sediment metagenome]
MDKKKLYCFLFIIILTLGLITPILLYLFYPGKVITLDLGSEKYNMLGNIIGGFIVILVGTALLPTVAQQVGTAQADGNVTGAAD